MRQPPIADDDGAGNSIPIKGRGDKAAAFEELLDGYEPSLGDTARQGYLSSFVRQPEPPVQEPGDLLAQSNDAWPIGVMRLAPGERVLNGIHGRESHGEIP